MIRYFISDLHLSDKRPDLIRAFALLVDELVSPNPPKELYILGDFFEAYIGDDFQPDWIKTLDHQFQRLEKAEVKTYFLPGNRDFLVGEDWYMRNHVVPLPEQSKRKFASCNILLSHGDEFCVDDQDYQTFRNMVRQPAWQQQVLAMPLEQRIALAQKLRNDSKSMSADKSDAIMDVNPKAVTDALDCSTNLLIHGHTHRPALHQYEATNRLVLGDWNQHVWVALMSDHGITQRCVVVDEYLTSPQLCEQWEVIHTLSW